MTFHTTDGLRPVTPYPQGIAMVAIPFTRQAIGDEIERLISLLDAAEADPDLEPAGDELDASYPEGGSRPLPHPHEDDEPMLGASCDHHGGGSQEHWAEAADNAEREVENEHGGDILDVPHDDDLDAEPWLGWGNPMAERPKADEGGLGYDSDDTLEFYGAGTNFDGKGHDLAGQQLRGAKPRTCRKHGIIGERDIPLPNGGVMRVFVPAWTGCVVQP